MGAPAATDELTFWVNAAPDTTETPSVSSITNVLRPGSASDNIFLTSCFAPARAETGFVQQAQLLGHLCYHESSTDAANTVQLARRSRWQHTSSSKGHRPMHMQQISARAKGRQLLGLPADSPLARAGQTAARGMHWLALQNPVSSSTMLG